MFSVLMSPCEIFGPRVRWCRSGSGARAYASVSSMLEPGEELESDPSLLDQAEEGACAVVSLVSSSFNEAFGSHRQADLART